MGAHNIFRLRGADWNDALDMASEHGESVAFTCAYAGNFRQLARLLRREDGPVELLEEIQELYGFKANAIVSMADVVEHLYNRECLGQIVIDDKIKSAIDAYYEQYGVK